MDKSTIRDQVKIFKKMMTSDEIEKKSNQIMQRLLDLKEYQESESIYIYVNYNQEVITLDIIMLSIENGKKIYVPKVYDGVIQFHLIHSINELVSGAYGILEPNNTLIDSRRDGLLIMPGLAFDKEHHRIGYGGGFYDKYLALDNNHYKIALSYEFQIFEQIDTDSYDICVDKIITEENTY